MEVNHGAGSHLHQCVVFGNCGSRDFCFVFSYCWWTGGLLSCLWCFWTALLAPLTCLWHFWTTLPVPRSLVVSLVKCLLYKTNDRTFQAAGHLGADRQDVSSLSKTYITRSRRFQPALRTSKTTSFNSADKNFLRNVKLLIPAYFAGQILCRRLWRLDRSDKPFNKRKLAGTLGVQVRPGHIDVYCYFWAEDAGKRGSSG